MSQYSDQAKNRNENQNGLGSQMSSTLDKKKEKINWDREVDFVFDEMKKSQVGNFTVDLERNPEKEEFSVDLGQKKESNFM